MVKAENKTSQYKYAIIVTVGSILLVLILGLTVGRTTWNSFSNTLEELNVKREVLAKLETKLENLKKLKDKEAELKEKNTKVLAALPEDKDVARLFVQFEGIAAASGLNVKRASEATATSDAGAQATTPTQSSVVKPVTYTISSDMPAYDALKNALSKFEQALRILSLTTVDINKSTESGDVTFTVTTYVRSTK